MAGFHKMERDGGRRRERKRASEDDEKNSDGVAESSSIYFPLSAPPLSLSRSKSALKDKIPPKARPPLSSVKGSFQIAKDSVTSSANIL